MTIQATRKDTRSPMPSARKSSVAKDVAGLPHLVTRGDDERGKGEKKRIFRRDLPVKTDQ